MENMVLLFVAVFGCSGFWTLVQYMIQRKLDKGSAQSKMLEGLGHDRICFLAGSYIRQGWISKEDYENLNDYLYKPYLELGGNGTAKRLMKEVEKLPIGEAGDKET